MPTPFPGMDPFVDRPQDWSDFHERFIPALANAIELQLPEPFRTRIDANVYIHERTAEERLLLGRPDAFVTGPKREASAARIGTLTAPRVAGAPAGIEIDEISFLEIRDNRDNTVVTAIELLSPANKAGGGDRDQYQLKVHRYLKSETHFVEIDLLRSGLRTNWSDLEPSEYSVVVSRVEDRPKVDHWPIRMRDRLPVIPIPLSVGLPEPVVDLQQVLNDVYDAARYSRYIYKYPLSPPLSEADDVWAAAILAEANITTNQPSTSGGQPAGQSP